MEPTRKGWWRQPGLGGGGCTPAAASGSTHPLDAPDSQVERLPWETAVTRMNWWPGEHVTLIGPTGRGKTEVEIALMEHRQWRVFLSTKRKDSTADKLIGQGYRSIRDPAELNPEVASSYLFRPSFPKNASAEALKAAHRGVYASMLMRLREQMGWTIGVDETWYIAQYLQIASELELLWFQGRSEGTSVVANTQRPRNVPLAAYSQATHLFFWSTPDLGDVRRIGEMTPLPLNRIVAVLASQSMHDVLYVNTVTGDMFQTNTRW
jgi:hypothetical protein